SAQRYSMLTFWPSTNPATPRPWRKASREPWAKLFGDRVFRNPTTGIACCARTASGHDTAAPPRNVMNSRRWIWIAIHYSQRSSPSTGGMISPCAVRLLVEFHRRLAEEHEIRWDDRDRPIDAEDRDLDLVTGLDGIGDDDPFRDVKALDRGRAGDTDAARHLPVDPHFGVVVHVGGQHRLGVRGVEDSNLGWHCQVSPVPQERQFTAATPVQQLLGLKGRPRGIVEALHAGVRRDVIGGLVARHGVRQRGPLDDLHLHVFPLGAAVNRSTTSAGGRTGASCGGDVGGSGWADAASIDRAMASIVPATSLARSRVLMVVLPFLMTARASAAAATRPPSPSGCCRSRARTRSPATASTSWPGTAACRHDTHSAS